MWLLLSILLALFRPASPKSKSFLLPAYQLHYNQYTTLLRFNVGTKSRMRMTIRW